MLTLSLSMIVKDEEKTIERVLACARPFCDELIVVDTGSTDRTVELAEQAGAKVYHFEWVDDFSAARNFAFEKCAGDWILWLDADDVVPASCQKKFGELKQHTLNNKLDAVFIPYYYHYTETGVCDKTVIRERLIRRAANLRWEYPVHECITIQPEKSLNRQDIWIEHRPSVDQLAADEGRNLRILEKALQHGDKSPRTLFYHAEELAKFRQWEDAVKAYHRYLEKSELGWERYSALVILSACYSMMENEEEAVSVCQQAIQEDASRAEALVQMGMLLYNKQEWEKAIPFFTDATHLSRPATGFITEPVYSWVPYEYLSLCYHNLGQKEKAMEMAMKAAPDHPGKPALLELSPKY